MKESKKDVKTSANNDVLYPVSLLGAKLESETVSSIEGDKNHILKFSGDKSFTMVETQVNDQQVMQFSDDEVIDLIDGFAIINLENYRCVIMECVFFIFTRFNERRNDFSHDKYANFIDKIKRFQIEL